jgi:hypothetical protein
LLIKSPGDRALIVDISHLGVCAHDIESSLPSLEACGFEPVFKEVALANRPEKRPLLRHYSPLHDIALFKHRASGLHLELIEYETVHDTTAKHFPITVGGRMKVPDAAKHLIACNGRDDEFTAKIAVSDLQAELTFLQKGLGFKLVEESSTAATLEKVSIISKTRFNLVVHQCARRDEVSYLDDAGSRFLSLLTTNVENDAKTLLRLGGSGATEPFSVEVNGRELRIVLLRSPGGAFIELLTAS